MVGGLLGLGLGLVVVVVVSVVVLGLGIPFWGGMGGLASGWMGVFWTRCGYSGRLFLCL